MQMELSRFKLLVLAILAGNAAELVEKYRAGAPEGFDPQNSKSDSWENSLLLHLFQNANVANIGDATGIRGSSAAGSLYISLHTADPGEAGSQNTSETSYTGYARVAVARTSGGWTVASDTVSNAALVTFGQCTVGTPTITHFGIGTDSSGAGTLLYSGALTASLAVSPGITPSFAIGALTVTEA